MQSMAEFFTFFFQGKRDRKDLSGKHLKCPRSRGRYLCPDYFHSSPCLLSYVLMPMCTWKTVLFLWPPFPYKYLSLPPKLYLSTCQVNNLYLYSILESLLYHFATAQGSFCFPMSIHQFFCHVSLTAQLDSLIPSSLLSPVMWWRAYADSDFSLLSPLLSWTLCPVCSYFPILPRPDIPGSCLLPLA